MGIDLVWPGRPRYPVLAPEDVHVWSIDIDVPAPIRVVFDGYLSIDERDRATRFMFARDGTRYVAAHGLLRTLLVAYLVISPSAIRFRIGEFGKPLLHGEDASGGLCFNLSHSDGIALCAVTRGRSVGVDVERMRPMVEMDRVAERFFSAGERAALNALPAMQRRAAFYACWSRKESYLKARARGLSLALDSFDISVAPSEHLVLLGQRGNDGTTSIWCLQDISPAPGYAAAVAVEGADCKITNWRWPWIDAWSGSRSVNRAPDQSNPTPIDSLPLRWATAA